MALDEHAAGLITGLRQQGFTSFSQMTVDQVRATIATFTDLQLPPQDVARVDETHYESDGVDLPLRIYTPGADTGPQPVVLYFHGGGFVAGDLTVVDEPARAVALATGATVVTAGYRLAPEHPFPAAADDAWAALQWVTAHIAEYGGDPHNLVVMGDSAGGNLAAGVALRARDEGAPVLRGQVLIYPALDRAADLPSRREFAEGYIVTAADMDWFLDRYFTSPGDAETPYALPARAADVDALPPTLVLTTENEVLRDEGEFYGRRLREAGVDVTIRRFDGLVHGAFWMSGAVPRSGEMRDEVAKFVTRTISGVPTR
ncbi:esterase [Rhodococcus rhodochrous]|uniref:alpha/beta hydrolase n=1 Tax=Rhodococcus rhodochrous TaxID=1829 RepID=UPI000750A2AB|nr:alpha/beta hydrolase [Rhodococcus rhodochrous]MDJ0396876.1 alpha/beta hydrolase [Rhodococcus rhodochrous]MDO1486126.1 alpha/beta hydrolase [Rhodococcus rhodochrous]SNV17083.1 esterase [Rhodococcus rhodochrous]